MSSIAICHRCQFRQQGCAGPCACTVDPERRDIIEHAESGQCPHNFFNEPDKVTPPAPPPIQPIPRGQWRLWAKMLATQAIESDAGLGDVLHRILTAVGADFATKKLMKVAAMGWKRLAGVEWTPTCGCAARRVLINARYSLK